MSHLIRVTSDGLYCEAGNFHIDPWRPVPRGIITHAHADHARRGCQKYLAAREGKEVLQLRMGGEAAIDTLAYGERLRVGGSTISFHPAGHILGSSQIRIETASDVCVVSGDYKLDSDPTCTGFESVACDTFVTECTFGLPIYRWPRQRNVLEEINEWWKANREQNRASLIFAYALGKAQRILAGIEADIGPIYCHGAVERVNAAYRAAHVKLPPTTYAGSEAGKQAWAGALILAPPSAMASPWTRRFGDASTAFASGWMRIRGMRRRRSVDRGFVLSDHADWPGLLSAIRQTGAARVLATHGHAGPMVRWLSEHGMEARSLTTAYVGEQDDADIDVLDTDAAPVAETDVERGDLL